jgi:hypothetical protein
MTAFISGHLDLTIEEFGEHYVPKLWNVIADHVPVVVGDAPGADAMAQQYLLGAGHKNVVVYHMFTSPRNNAGFPTVGGYASDRERDEAMTKASTIDIAWVRPGREKTGTAENLARRQRYGAG